MAESNTIESAAASTRPTSTTTIMSTLYLTQTITLPNPNGTMMSTTLIPTHTSTMHLVPTQTDSPPAYHIDPHAPAAPATSNRAVIAGGVTGSIAGVAVIGIIAFVLWKRRRTPSEAVEEKPEREKAYSPRKSVDWRERRSFHQL